MKRKSSVLFLFLGGSCSACDKAKVSKKWGCPVSVAHGTTAWAHTRFGQMDGDTTPCAMKVDQVPARPTDFKRLVGSECSHFLYTEVRLDH
ncbi:hypothetical protein V8E55_011482 [Tylopilus felleus]